MSPGATFERVYRALREQLGAGRFRPGDPLEPRALSDDLNASITPVRDALHRLVGEQFIEAPRASGFRVPILTEVALRHLYAWHEALLLLGAAGTITAGTEPAMSGDGAPEEAAQRAELLFKAVAARTGNPEHFDAVARLGARLRPIRAVEEIVLGSSSDELAPLENDLARNDRSGLRRGIRSYHRRRDRAAALLVARLVGR